MMTPDLPDKTEPREALRPLRQELSILAGNEAGSWLLYDPVRGKYHKIGKTAVVMLTHWQAIPAPDFLDHLSQSAPEIEAGEDLLQELTEFLLQEKLLIHPPEANAETLAGQEAATRKPLHEQLIHKYLFFRIPLFQPQAFLARYGPYVSAFFRPATAWTICLIGLIGLLFALRQWEQFVSTFLYFFTLQGFLFYALSLVIIKALHELGHAFAAHHYGARVPIIGLAFLVMFPVLYTDTTDVWRIADRRARLWINGAGIITELSIAAISLFLWSFLPDGMLRSAAFFAATTSWTLSLLVNINPWMRFDGYYLMSDFTKVENLQARGFAAGRWVMRKTLLGLDEGAPEPLTRRQKRGLCLYAWSTWVYRFFLFIGIALLIHHIFPKAIGIVLFVIEIGIFIALPISRELRHWWRNRMQILKHNRGRVSLSLSAAALALFLIPWQTRLSAPALIQPAEQTNLYAPSPSKIVAIHAQNGDYILRGDVLIELSSPTLAYQHDIAAQELAMAQARWKLQGSSNQDRQLRDIFRDSLAEKQTALTAIKSEIAELNLRAPHDGHINDLPLSLHAGQYINPSHKLLQITSGGGLEMIALPKDVYAARIEGGARFTFISDQAGRKARKGEISSAAPMASQVITDTVLTAQGGGSIATAQNIRGEAIADIPVFRVQGHIAQAEPQSSLRMERGVAIITAKRASPARTVWKNVAKVLLRETDF